jgi:hypothetical protein
MATTAQIIKHENDVLALKDVLIDIRRTLTAERTTNATTGNPHGHLNIANRDYWAALAINLDCLGKEMVALADNIGIYRGKK